MRMGRVSQERTMRSALGQLIQPKIYVPAILLACLLAFPAIGDAYFLNIMIMIFLFAALGSAWNLIGGYGGQFSLGHAAYFGLGAYTTAILAVHFNISPWIGMLIGALLSLGLSVGIGAICFRLRGHYFAISTLVICEVLRLIALRERWLTNGGVGLSVPYKGDSALYFQFLDKTPYYFIALALLISVMYVTYRISKSKTGYYLRAIGQNHDAAEVIGINTAAVKRKILAISAVFTSICGTFWVQYMYFIDPEMGFGLSLSIEIACIAVVGGMGTVFGPFFGALILRPLTELTSVTLGSTYSGIHLIVYALILIIIVIWRPKGIGEGIMWLYSRLIAFLPNSIAESKVSGEALPMHDREHMR